MYKLFLGKIRNLYFWQTLSTKLDADAHTHNSHYTFSRVVFLAFNDTDYQATNHSFRLYYLPMSRGPRPPTKKRIIFSNQSIQIRIQRNYINIMLRSTCFCLGIMILPFHYY